MDRARIAGYYDLFKAWRDAQDTPSRLTKRRPVSLRHYRVGSIDVHNDGRDFAILIEIITRAFVDLGPKAYFWFLAAQLVQEQASRPVARPARAQVKLAEGVLPLFLEAPSDGLHKSCTQVGS